MKAKCTKCGRAWIVSAYQDINPYICPYCVKRRDRLSKLFTLVSALSFLLMLGSVGGMENYLLPMWQGTGQALLFMALGYIFAKMAIRRTEHERNTYRFE